VSDVIVLGAGPAGCAVALGLTRLGVAVRILSRPRTDTVEGDAYAACAALAGPKHTGGGRIETRPVLNGSHIELRDIWVSADWPRGIWQVNGREWRPTSNKEVEGVDR